MDNNQISIETVERTMGRLSLEKALLSEQVERLQAEVKRLQAELAKQE